MKIQRILNIYYNRRHRLEKMNIHRKGCKYTLYNKYIIKHNKYLPNFVIKYTLVSFILHT